MSYSNASASPGAGPAIKPVAWGAIAIEALRKLSPRVQWKNPVMFVVYLGSIVATLLWVQALTGQGEASTGFIFWVAAWLWFTVLFANAAEALAEGRGKAQAEALRATRQRVTAKVLKEPRPGSAVTPTPSEQLTIGTILLVEAGDIIPADGEVIEGVASVDESAITGESAPVIRESGGDFCSVTGGTRVLSDWVIVRVTANPGEAFLDRMIAMVEGA
ncbi:MAG TPA: potassium-transporting ATPase subunit B, partial [Roseomonas sp.]